MLQSIRAGTTMKQKIIDNRTAIVQFGIELPCKLGLVRLNNLVTKVKYQY